MLRFAAGFLTGALALKHPSCVNLCHVCTVQQSDLRIFVGTAGGEKMRAVCRALAIACGCE